MDQKTIAIAVIVIVVIAVIGVGAYWFLSNPGENGTEPTPTPTATPTGVADATSLEYSVVITGGDSAGTYDFYAKNIGSNDLMIRNGRSAARQRL